MKGAKFRWNETSQNDIPLNNQYNNSSKVIKNEVFNNLLNLLARSKEDGNAVKTKKKSKLPKVDYPKQHSQEKIIDRTISPEISGLKKTSKQTLAMKNKKINDLHSQAETRSLSPDEKNQFNHTIGQSASVMAFKRFMDEIVPGGSNKNSSRDQDAAYSKNLLGKSGVYERGEYLETIQKASLMFDSPNKSRALPKGEGICIRSPSDMIRSIVDVKASKMPSSYCNISPVFTPFQGAFKSYGEVSPVRQTPVSMDIVPVSIKDIKLEKASSEKTKTSDMRINNGLASPSVQLNTSMIEEEYLDNKKSLKQGISVIGLPMITKAITNTSKRIVFRLQAKGKKHRKVSSSEELEETESYMKNQYSKAQSLKRVK